MTNIGPDEWQDCETELRSRKRNRDEFEFSETVAPMQGAGVQTLQGTVTVRNRKTGVARQYRTGFGSTWVSDLAHDLAGGVL